jgi:hypothetical protein
LINRLFGNIIKRIRDYQSPDKEMKKQVSYDPSDIPRLIKTLDDKSTARFKVDIEKRFDAVFERYYQHLWDGKLVTAANILGSSGRIARFRHDLAGRITEQLLKVDTIPLPTAECREVARGHVLVSLAEYSALWKSNSSVHDFILRCTSSHRPAVKERAAALLAEYFDERLHARGVKETS